MTVVYPPKFRKLRIVEERQGSAKPVPATTNEQPLQAVLMDVIGDLQSASLLLTDLGAALSKGMPANPQDLGNAEVIVSILRALIRTAACSPRGADQHLARLLKLHLKKIEEEIACPSA